MSGKDIMFEEAMKAVHGGEREHARDLLTRLIKKDREQAEYWVWMSAVVDTPRERSFCLNEALRIEPQNAAARRGLALLGERPPEPELAIPLKQQKRAWQSGENPEKALTMDTVRLAALAVGGLVLVGAVFALAFNLARPAPVSKPLAPLHLPATATLLPTNTLVAPSATATFIGPTPLAMMLQATYTPTPMYVNTPHPIAESYRIGLRALQRGEYLQAAEYMSQAATAEPGSVDVLFYMGEALRQEGDYDAARQVYQQAIELNPNFAPVYLSRARMVLDSGVKDLSTARADLERAMQADPQWGEPPLEMARLELAEGNPEAALKALDQAEKNAPDSPLLFLYRAQAQLALGQNEEALAAAQQANELDATQLEAYWVLAQALAANERVSEAVAPLNTYLTYQPENAAALALLARAYAADGQVEPALDALDRAIALDPNVQSAYLLRAQLALLDENYRDALGDFDRALRLEPKSYDAAMGRGQALMALEYFGDAYLEFERAFGVAADDAARIQAQLWRARSLDGQGQTKAALRDWRALAELPEGALTEEEREEALARVEALAGVTETPPPAATATRTPAGPTPTRGAPTRTPTPARTPTP